MTSQADQVEALTAQLRADLQGISSRIQQAEETLIQSWPALGRIARVRALAALRRTVLALAASAQAIARAGTGGSISRAYSIGGQAMAATAGQTAVFGGIDTAAVTVLAEDAYASVLAATQGVRESTKTLVRVLARQHVLDKLVTGQTPGQAATQLAAQLAERRIHAITYADGSRHQLGEYTDMLVRTKAAEASQQGGFAQARSLGIDYVEILDGPGCGLTSHRDPRKAHGLILPLDEAAKYPLSHPRCRRTSIGRPDLSSPADAAAARPIGPQFAPADIAREHASGGTGTTAAVISPAAARAQARTTARTITVPGGSAAASRAAARATKRAGG